VGAGVIGGLMSKERGVGAMKPGSKEGEVVEGGV